MPTLAQRLEVEQAEGDVLDAALQWYKAYCNQRDRDVETVKVRTALAGACERLKRIRKED